MKKLIFVVVVFVLCFPSKAGVPQVPDEEIFNVGALPVDGGFEWRSTDWFLEFTSDWESFPWPEWEIPTQPWPQFYFSYYDVLYNIPAYPEGWFLNEPDVPVRPLYYFAPSAQAWSVMQFNPRHWLTCWDITRGGYEMTWADSIITPRSEYRLLVLTTGPLVMPVEEYYTGSEKYISLDMMGIGEDFYNASIHLYIYLMGGEEITFEYLFCTSDYIITEDVSDYAEVKLIPFDANYPEIPLVFISVEDVGNKGRSGWLNCSYQVPELSNPNIPNDRGRAYYISFGVYDLTGGDTLCPSFLLVDNLNICSETSKPDLWKKDCRVDMKDYAILANALEDGNEGWKWELYDLNDDKQVDVQDIASMSSRWLTGEK